MKVYVNGQPVVVAAGRTVLQACEQSRGVEVGRFCYHKELGIAGNCRMCRVEVNKSPKPVASCALPVHPGMEVWTESPCVLKAREGVRERRLKNHPLDCPICDQAGECDLQEQSRAMGSESSRNFVGKRGSEDKALGSVVKTVMTRCIKCTRCVRFNSERMDHAVLGSCGRGEGSEIGTYVETRRMDPRAGNLVDLCPVGALTNKRYAFQDRPWNLVETQSVDEMDGLGTKVRVQSQGSKVIRVRPREDRERNGEWLGDKSRRG